MAMLPMLTRARYFGQHMQVLFCFYGEEILFCTRVCYVAVFRERLQLAAQNLFPIFVVGSKFLKRTSLVCRLGISRAAG